MFAFLKYPKIESLLNSLVTRNLSFLELSVFNTSYVVELTSIMPLVSIVDNSTKC